MADYLQRAARHIASKTDVEHAYSVGEMAVEFALEGKNSVMPSIVRENTKRYKWSIGEVSLNRVANKEKMLPRNFISKDGYGITKRAIEYLQPLIEGEAYPNYRKGLPRYVELKNIGVQKKN